MCSPLVFGDDTDDAQDQPPEPAHGAARPASFGTTDFTAVGASALATVSADRPIGAAGTQLASAAAVPVQDDALRTRRPPAVTGADDRPIGKAPEIVLSNDLEARVTALRGGATGAMRQAYRPKFVAPTHGTLTSGFGPRWGTMHRGIDIANALGTPIVSVADGTVIEAGPASGFGLWVRIRHDDGTITVYGHMYEFSVHAGQRVRAGQQIATIGSNGHSTGPHLHFEVHVGGTPVDPIPWLRARGVSVG